jgi:hypothetical protein
MTAIGRVRVPIWLKLRPHSRLLTTGANVRSLASNLNFCRPAYAALPKYIPFKAAPLNLAKKLIFVTVWRSHLTHLAHRESGLFID